MLLFPLLLNQPTFCSLDVARIVGWFWGQSLGKRWNGDRWQSHLWLFLKEFILTKFDFTSVALNTSLATVVWSVNDVWCCRDEMPSYYYSNSLCLPRLAARHHSSKFSVITREFGESICCKSYTSEASKNNATRLLRVCTVPGTTRLRWVHTPYCHVPLSSPSSVLAAVGTSQKFWRGNYVPRCHVVSESNDD